MELTGKCKTDFEKWWNNKTSPALTGELHYFGINCKGGFDCLTDSMRYGVYLEFFDIVNYDIEIIKSGKQNIIFTPYVNNEYSYSEYTKHEARIKAIEKANEIYNK